MVTNLMAGQLHVKVHAFCNTAQCKPRRRHAFKLYQLFTSRKQCLDFSATPMGSLGTDMFTNPTIVQLDVKMGAKYVCRRRTSWPGKLTCSQNVRNLQAAEFPPSYRTAVTVEFSSTRIKKKPLVADFPTNHGPAT